MDRHPPAPLNGTSGPAPRAGPEVATPRPHTRPDVCTPQVRVLNMVLALSGRECHQSDSMRRSVPGIEAKT